MERMKGRGKNKQVKNVTSRGDRYSAVSCTSVNTMIQKQGDRAAGIVQRIVKVNLP